MTKDIIVIGAGAAGMTAALYALRNGKSVLVLEGEAIGGQIASSPKVENFPSLASISGIDFSNNLFDQISALGAEFEVAEATSLIKTDAGFSVETDFGTHFSKSVIVANGVKHKKLRLKDEETLVGHGISYCAICDGAFYAGKEVALVGDGNTALQYALLLSNYCTKVYVYTLFDKFFGDEALVKTLRAKSNIEVRPNTALYGTEGTEELEAILYSENGENKRHQIGALFIAIGQIPNNAAFADAAELDSEGYFASDETCTTKTAGLFVAGDCRAKKIRQLTTAACDGAVAALGACAYIESL